MSIRLMAHVWDNGPADPTDCFTLLCLAQFANDKGDSCFPSIERIAQMIRCSSRTAKRSIANLKAGGWITTSGGRGRGLTSSYVLNVEQLKSGAAVATEKVTDTTEKGDTGDTLFDTEKVTDTTVKGDKRDRKRCQTRHSPTPPIRKNRHRTVIDPSCPAASAKASPDVRFAPFRESFAKYFAHKTGKDAPWDGHEGAALKRWLAANPSYSLEEWRRVLNNRAKSPVAHAKRLSGWIEYAAAWLNGRADDWGKQITEGSKTNGNNGNHTTKAGRTFEAARAVIERIENRVSAHGDGGDEGRGVEPEGAGELFATVIEGKR